jgi:ribonuclease E
MSDPVPQLPNEPTNLPESPAEGDPARKPRRRGSRGGRNRNRSRTGQSVSSTESTTEPATGPRTEPTTERPTGARKPQIGDTLPAPTPASTPAPARTPKADGAADDPAKRRRRRGGRGRSRGSRPVESVVGEAVELDAETLERRRGRERKGRPVGRYLMCVHAQAEVTQIAVLEGRALIEHYVSRQQDDATQIHGNIYLGRVQNVLPGMEAAFVDIGTPKNAVLYRGDLQFDADDVDGGGGGGSQARIEQILKARQSIVSQVTKNPIGAKGARLTQEVSLPGRFVVLIPNSSTYGISKRLSDDERKRLRSILDKIKPAEHGLIVRTAADGATREELERDVARLLGQWERIDALAKSSNAPQLLYREPDVAVRVIREEFNSSYRGVVIDDRQLYEEVRDYVASITPELADRVEYHDPEVEPLPLFETFHVHEQVHKALDRKVWLPSGGSLIIERTEALTVIDVNTGKNVGSSSLEETVFRNNLEAAEEVARQLRLRDIGGIIVIDFIDMEIKKNRDEVIRVFREALARDKTRTQVFDISELGLVEMTRKRIGEGLIESMSSTCPVCEGRGMVFDKDLLGS